MIARHCICCDSERLARSPAILMPFVAARAFGWEPVCVEPEWGLRDLQSGMAYPLCSSVLCSECGTLFLDIRFSDDEMAALYADYRGDAYTTMRNRFEPGYAARNALLTAGVDYIPAVEAFLAPFVPSRPQVLDWGGDTGRNTPFLRNAAKLHVFDISTAKPVSGAQPVTRDQIERDAYDLVVFSNVLEHIPEPLRALRDIHDAVGTHPIVYLEVPHEDLMRSGVADAQTRKRHWHEHVNFFSERGVARLLARAGFHILAQREFEVDVGGKHAYQLGLVVRSEQSSAR